MAVWACLRFPELALDALSASVRERTVKPVAVVDGPSQRRRILFANDAARAGGVREDQPLAAAQAVCPGLDVRPRDAAAEHALLDMLAALAYRFSADVVVAPPAAIHVEIGASLALFGGWPALERRLRRELSALGLRHAIAAAPSAAAAQVLAFGADGCAIFAGGPLQTALGGVAIAASGLDETIVAALSGMGFRRLADVFRLPRAELARRIGADAILHLDRLRGFAAERLPRYRPPDRFERRVELSFGVENSASLAFPLQRLVGELARFLIARDGGVERFSIVLGHERGARTRIEIGLLAPQRDAAELFALSRARLDRIALAAPVHEMILIAEDLPGLAPLHEDLFDDGGREALAWPALAERLRARLGDEALNALAVVADHRPEQAWRFVAPTASTRGAVALGALVRPLWLLPRPRPLRPEPAAVLAGPERIESGWWDGGDARRDYYVVRMQSGQRAWAFTPAGARAGWMLHGWFA